MPSRKINFALNKEWFYWWVGRSNCACQCGLISCTTLVLGPVLMLGPTLVLGPVLMGARP